MSTRKKTTHSKSAFHRHVKFHAHDCSNVHDLTEYKLRRLLEVLKDQKQKNFIAKLLEEYLKGLIQIAWEDGVVPYYSLTPKKKL